MTYPGIDNDPATLAANEDMAAVEQRRREREDEYGTWVAVQEIPWGTVLAHVAGDRVPASTVKRLKWDELDLVVKRSTKAGREVLERTGNATADEIAAWAEQDKAAAQKQASNATETATTKKAN